MYTNEAISNNESFSDDVILNQVQKILQFPVFAVSGILCKFLKYIINESLCGRASQIKEYTIAVYALKKPHDFRPFNNGIVRVHARRLRDALTSYYEERGIEDACEITIPKGGYFPVFRVFKSQNLESDIKRNNECKPLAGDSAKIAVMPFKTFEEGNSRLAFTENLGQMLSREFIHLPHFTVLPYYTTQQLQSKNREIKGIASDYGIDYVLAGNVYFDSARIRVIIQLIKAGTGILIWSEKYMYNFTARNLFEIEDMIVHKVMTALEEFSDQFSKKIFQKLAKVEFKPKWRAEFIHLNETREGKKMVSL